jgi:glucosylceramidase
MNLRYMVTTCPNNKVDTQEEQILFQQEQDEEMPFVNLYPEHRYQSFEGFGGAITEASGYAFSKMSEEKQNEVLQAYFGADGNRYRFARMAIDSCDFSLGNYSAVTDAGDDELSTFSLERDEQYILPLLRKAQEVLGQPIEIMLSPWSPPAFMKSNGAKNGGGFLNPEYRALWARYLCRYVREYRKMGFSVTMLTIQNEPKAAQRWDSCLYTAEQEKAFLRDFLYPELMKSGLEDVQVCIWDHNKERVFDRAQAIIDQETDKMVQGIAFHWYSGDHFDTLRLTREVFPDKKLIFSEGCVEYSRFAEENQLAHAQMYAHDIIGNLNAGMNVSLDWNIILDEKGGPNHVGNYCEAPIMCDTKNDTVIKNASYTYIRHFSRFIQPGAQRIAASTYTDKLEITAFRNPDDTITAVLLNRTDSVVPVSIRLAGQLAPFAVPANAIVTALIGGYAVKPN